MNAPQQPKSQSSLPRWVIPVAVAGAIITFVLPLGIAGSLLWAFAQGPSMGAGAASGPGALESPGGGSSTQPRDERDTGDSANADDTTDADRSELRLRPPGGDFAPDQGPSSESGQLAGEVQAIADYYLEARRDGTINELVPGGASVDPDYVGAFLYVLADLKSATRFGGTPSELQELLDKARDYEARFLAGEDLDVSVRITRADGSVFDSDGVYRLVE